MDVIDRAQDLEEFQREAALRRTLGLKARPVPAIPEPTILTEPKPIEDDKV